MIEWLVTPIEAFNRNKRRLDAEDGKTENTGVMDPQGPSVISRGAAIVEQNSFVTVNVAAL